MTESERKNAFSGIFRMLRNMRMKWRGKKRSGISFKSGKVKVEITGRRYRLVLCTIKEYWRIRALAYKEGRYAKNFSKFEKM